MPPPLRRRLAHRRAEPRRGGRPGTGPAELRRLDDACCAAIPCWQAACPGERSCRHGPPSERNSLSAATSFDDRTPHAGGLGIVEIQKACVRRSHARTATRVPAAGTTGPKTVALRHDLPATDAESDRAVSVELKPTGEANSEAVDDGNALQGREAANLSAQENCPQPEALQQVASVCGFVPTSGNTPQVEDRGLEPLTFWLPARRSPN